MVAGTSEFGGSLDNHSRTIILIRSLCLGLLFDVDDVVWMMSIAQINFIYKNDDYLECDLTRCVSIILCRVVKIVNN